MQLLRGSALVEAADIQKENQIRIVDDGAQTTLLKRGVYRFNADTDSVAVYDGKARVMFNDRTVELKGGHEVNLTGPLVDKKFDRKETQKADDLFTWSKLRSEQLSQASEATARTFVVNNRGYPGSGFYWSPFYRTYAWMPGDAFFSSPFGPSYYSPWAFVGPVYHGPAYYRIRPRWVPSGGAGPVIRPGGAGRIHQGINPGVGRPR